MTAKSTSGLNRNLHDPTPSAESILIELLRSRATSGLQYVYDNYGDAIYGVIVRIVKSTFIAEEVMQDVFMKVWDRIEEYDAGKSKLFTWMYRIARNQAIDKIRSREIKNGQRTDRLEVDSSDHQTRVAFEISVDQIGLSENLAHLTSDQQFIIQMIYFEGYTHSEIAKEYDIPLGTVKTRARSGLKRLRELIPG